MTEEEILKRAFAMPLTSPAFPPGPYRFVNREYLIITYRTDPERLRAIVPEPLALDAPLVKYEFILMPIPPALAITLRAVSHPGVVQRPPRELHALHVP